MADDQARTTAGPTADSEPTARGESASDPEFALVRPYVSSLGEPQAGRRRSRFTAPVRSIRPRCGFRAIVSPRHADDDHAPKRRLSRRAQVVLVIAAIVVLVGSIVGVVSAWRSDSSAITVPSNSEPAIVFPSAPGTNAGGIGIDVRADRRGAHTEGTVPVRTSPPSTSSGGLDTPKTLPGTGTAAPPTAPAHADRQNPGSRTDQPRTAGDRSWTLVTPTSTWPRTPSTATTSTYWESTNNAFPQSITVDLGATRTLVRIVLKVPPLSTWGTRTQTIWILGSVDGSRFTTIVGAADYTFNPATGNTVTIPFPATGARYVRLMFSENTGWPAGQASEIEIYGT